MMTISVIIPVLNGEKFISMAIESILRQEYHNWEIIIVDDGSTDRTAEIARSFCETDVRIKFFPSTVNRGISASINEGIKNSRGDVIAYSGADDWYANGALGDVVNFFMDYPDIMWAYGDYNNVSISAAGLCAPEFVSTPSFDYQRMLGGNYIGLQDAFFRRSLFNIVGLFDETYYYSMDHEFWLRIGKKYLPKKINKVVINHIWHGENYSTIKQREQVFDCLRASIRYGRTYPEKIMILRAFLRYLYYLCKGITVKV